MEITKQSYQKDLEDFKNIAKDNDVELKYYVYALADPRGEKEQVFYVGKGKGTRMYAHIMEAFSKENLSNNDLSEKVDIIQQIHKSGHKVEMYIVHFGLSEEAALLVESVMIDVFNNFKSIDTQSIRDLTTKQSGVDSRHGFCNITTLIRTLKATEPICVQGDEKVLVLKIVEPLTEDNEIYERVRKYWRVNLERANKMTYVAACNNGVIIGLYQPKQSENGKHGGWRRFDNPGDRNHKRCYFEGESVKDEEVRCRYIDHIIETKKGASNPVRYIEDC